MINIFKKAIKGWSSDNISVWSSSLAYFTVFSLSPLLLLLVSIMGLVFGKDAVQGSLVSQIRGLVGDQGALFIQSILQNASKPSSNIIAGVISIVTLLLGALGIFSQIQQAFNHIWDVKTAPKAGIKALIFDKILSFSMLVIIAFLLAISLVLSVGVNALATYIQSILHVAFISVAILNEILSAVVLTLLFGLMFKVLPDVKIPFKAVWLAAFLTALFFTLGKTVIGIYIGHSNYLKTYGAAGSVLALLVWVYYSAQIMLFGAEFTKAYSQEKNIEVVPNEHAIATNSRPVVTSNKPQTSFSMLATYAFLGFTAELIHTSFQKKPKPFINRLLPFLK